MEGRKGPQIAILCTVLMLAGRSAHAQSGPQHNWVVDRQADIAVPIRPLAFAVYSNRFFAVGSTSSLRQFDFSGVSLGSSGYNGFDLAVDEQSVYLAGGASGKIFVFDKNLNLTATAGSGSAGSGPDDIWGAFGVDIDDLHIYVADRYNSRVQVFQKDGTPYARWGEHGSGLGQLSDPVDVEIHGNELYVVDDGNNRIKVFTKTGQYIRGWEAPPDLRTSASTRLAIDDRYLYANSVSDAWGAPPDYVYVYDHFGDFKGKLPVGGTVAQGEMHIAATHAGRLFGIHRRGTTQTEYEFLEIKQLYRTLGEQDYNEVPDVAIKSVAQRAGRQILDVDFVAYDPDDSTVSVFPTAFVQSSNALPYLADMVPMRTFVDGTSSNIGPGIATGVVHRLSWDMEADNISGLISDFGNVQVVLTISDGRDLLDLHFLTIPEVTTNNPSFEINRSPVYDTDFLPIWLRLVAADDPGVVFSNRQVHGGPGSGFDGQLLATGVSTTPQGRSFLFQREGVREATADELRIAREASSPGDVKQWTPLRNPPPSGYKVNEFNFVTSPSNGWWVVPTP